MLRLLIFFFSMFHFSVYSQYKFEREYKVSSEKVPSQAINFIVLKINYQNFLKNIK